jgi:hypothetical protein
MFSVRRILLGSRRANVSWVTSSYHPRMSSSAADYLRELSDSMSDAYPGDCVTHACRIAELLLAEGRSPWIARVRDVQMLGERVFHGPLLPARFSGRATTIVWTTHYVACSGREAYDPLVGAPIDIDTYSDAAFGKELAVETHLDSDATARLLASGEIRRHFRPRPR